MRDDRARDLRIAIVRLRQLAADRSALRRRRSARSRTRSPAAASSGTWSAPSSARSSRSGAAGGRPEWMGEVLASRDRDAGRADGAGARAVSRARRLRRACGRVRLYNHGLLRRNRMSLEQLLAWIPPGSPDEALARQVNFDQLPAHVAIIMDGNGRWAAQRHLPRVEGHRAGIDSVRDVVETSARLGIERADALRVLGRELEAAARRSQHADDAAQALPPARARARCSRTTSAST